MTFVAFILCVLIVVVAALGVASPPRILSVARKAQTRRGLYTLAAVRVILGVALLFSASTSRAPGLIAVFGVIIIGRGVILPFIGVERVRRLLDWFGAQGSAFVRGWAVLALALGLLVVYAIAP